MLKATQQTILGAIFSYTGIALGAFYQIFIIPKLFASHTESYGTLVFLMNYVGLFLILSSFATPLSVVKFYPISRKEAREKTLSFLLALNGIGLIISFLYFFLFANPITLKIEGNYIDISYFFYPMLICMTFSTFFESYCHVLLKIAGPTFLSNTFTRLWFFAILILHFYDIINFKTFSYLYFGQFAASFLLLLLFVWQTKKDRFRLNISLPSNYKEILHYSLFALPATSAAVLIAKIDLKMIGDLLDKAEVAYYNHAIFFISVLLIPKRTLANTFKGIISKDIQTENVKNLIPKHLKISAAFLFSTLIIFIAIFINIEELMQILGDKFGSLQVKYAIIVLGLGRVIEAALTSNQIILEYSKHYKKVLFFELISLALLVALNFALIPKFGILGAAYSSAFIFIFNGINKSIFVYRKLGIKPISAKQLIIALSLSLLLLLYFLPLPTLSLFSSPILSLCTNIAIRSLLLLLILFGIAKHFKIGKELLHF